MNFAKAGHEGIGLYLRNVDYRFLEGMSKISPCILLVASSLRVMSTVFVLFWALKITYCWDIKILRRSYKIIHGENLDIGLGNHLNPKRSSKCTVFMTGFFVWLLCFLYVGGNGKFQVLFGDVNEKNHCEAKNVSAM